MRLHLKANMFFYRIRPKGILDRKTLMTLRILGICYSFTETICQSPLDGIILDIIENKSVWK